jgi:Zn-dependent protease
MRLLPAAPLSQRSRKARHQPLHLRRTPALQPDHPLSNISLYTASTWILPVVLAITFHEAAHGFVAHHFGDDTAFRLGRVSLNPLKHIDPFGTLVLPAMLLLSGSPFLFGYAKPVPVNFRGLKEPRRDMVLVAAAGPLTNIILATLAAAAFHLIGLVPPEAAPWVAANLKNALVINVVLAVFNLIPIPPLDGGRIAVGLLPNRLAVPLSRLEPFGMLILIGLLLVIPMLGTQFGLSLDIISDGVGAATGFVLRLILLVTGNL